MGVSGLFVLLFVGTLFLVVLRVASGCDAGVLCWVGARLVLATDCFFSGLAMGLRVRRGACVGVTLLWLGLIAFAYFLVGCGCLFCGCGGNSVI